MSLPWMVMGQDEVSPGSPGSYEEGKNLSSEGAEETVSETGKGDEVVDFSSFAETPEKALGINGSLVFKTRYLFNYDRIGHSGIETFPELKLRLHHENVHSELFTAIDLSKNVLFEDFGMLMDEAYVRLFYDKFNLAAGFMKVVWGKGDDVHVIDVLNPMDYTDFINPDYIERKAAEKMVKLDLLFGAQSQLELVYEPVFTPDTIPTAGIWTPYEVQLLYSTLEDMKLDPRESIVYPDTNRLDYSQLALRLSGVLGRFDLGAMYYYGFLREPSIDLTRLLTDNKVYISYDRVHVFGVEAACVSLGFNLRGEAGYYLTEDTAGDDPLVHNNRFGYVIGFDKNLPLSNLNLNMQVYGTCILKKGGIKAQDIEYDDEGKYTDTILVTSVTDSYRHGKILPEISFIYGIERGDYMIRPKLDLILRDDVKLTFLYSLFEGKRCTNFGQFRDNDFLQAAFTYSF